MTHTHTHTRTHTRTHDSDAGMAACPRTPACVCTHLLLLATLLALFQPVFSVSPKKKKNGTCRQPSNLIWMASATVRSWYCHIIIPICHIIIRVCHIIIHICHIKPSVRGTGPLAPLANQKNMHSHTLTRMTPHANPANPAKSAASTNPVLHVHPSMRPTETQKRM